MFVDPLGRDSQRTELLTEEVRVSDVALTDARTVYDRIGDVPAWAALATFVAAGFAGWRQGR
jgi:apolipoprotein N-acyltransferase